MILTWKTTIKMKLNHFIFSTIGLIQNTYMHCSVLFVNMYSTNCLKSNCSIAIEFWKWFKSSSSISQLHEYLICYSAFKVPATVYGNTAQQLSHIHGMEQVLLLVIKYYYCSQIFYTTSKIQWSVL